MHIVLQTAGMYSHRNLINMRDNKMTHLDEYTYTLMIGGDDSAVADGKETIEIAIHYESTQKKLSVPVTLTIVDEKNDGYIPIFLNGLSTVTLMTNEDGFVSTKLTSRYPGKFYITGFVETTNTLGLGNVTFEKLPMSNITDFPEGTHVFSPDTIYDDVALKATLTDKSCHYIGSYMTRPTNQSADDIHLQVINNQGNTLPETEIPQNRSNIQKDPTIVVIPNTDDFIVIWSSNAYDSDNFVICARKFRISNDTLIPLTEEIIISSTTQDNVGPCAIFNPTSESMLVSWFSVNDLKVHLQYFNKNMEPLSQAQTLKYSIWEKYFYRGFNMGNETYKDTDAKCVSMVNVGTYVYVTYKTSENSIGIFALKPGSLGTIEQVLVTEIEIYSLGFFDTAYDTEKNQIIVTYNNPSHNNYLYVLSVSLFSADNKHYRAIITDSVRINKFSSTCIAPSINPLNNLDENGNSIFVVAWLQPGQGIHYSYINSQKNLVQTERYINYNDAFMLYRPYVVASSNQVIIHLTSSALGNLSLDNLGTLYHVENYDF